MEHVGYLTLDQEQQ